MDFNLYFLVSLILALVFLPGLRLFYDPKKNTRMRDPFISTSAGHMDSMQDELIRKSLTGSLLRAGFLIIGWGATGIYLFLGEHRVPGTWIALLAALGWGFGLSIAIYNVHKWYTKPK